MKRRSLLGVHVLFWALLVLVNARSVYLAYVSTPLEAHRTAAALFDVITNTIVLFAAYGVVLTIVRGAQWFLRRRRRCDPQLEPPGYGERPARF